MLFIYSTTHPSCTTLSASGATDYSYLLFCVSVSDFKQDGGLKEPEYKSKWQLHMYQQAF
jgi:hypothetical protein